MKLVNFVKRYKAMFAACFFLALIACVYGQNLSHDYTYFDDDVLVLHNQDFISNYKNIPQFFCKSVFYSSKDFFYRPALTLSFAFDAMIAGTKPFMYHLSDILLHSLAVLLVFVFFRRLNFDTAFTFLFTVLFAVHPALSHAVSWIPGRNDTLLTIFVVSSMIFLFDYFENNKLKFVKLILFSLAFFAALLTKESAAAMPAVAAVFMFLFCKKTGKKDYFSIFTAMLLALCVYAAARFFVLGISGTPSDFNLLKSAKSFFVYMEYIIIPTRIYIFPETASADMLTASAGIIFFIPLTASLFFQTGNKKNVLFGLFWFAAFLAPSFMAFDRVLVFAHRLYLPSIGVMIMFIEFFSALSEKIRVAKKYLYALLVILIVLFALESFLQAQKFQNKEAYLSNALSEQPDSEILKLKSAEYYADKGMFEQAKKVIFGIESKDKIHSSMYYEILAYVYSLEGSFERAIDILEQLRALNPQSESALNNLSEIYYLKGEYSKALEYADMLIAVRPAQTNYIMQHNKIKNALEDLRRQYGIK